MRRHFCSTVLALVLISFFNSANPEDPAADIPPSAPEAVEPKLEERPAPAAEVPAPAPPQEPVVIPPVEVEPEKEEEKEETGIILDDLLPAGAVTEGVWEWDAFVKYSGEKSHTEPASKGMTEHSFTAAPLDVPADNLLEQYVWLDPKNTPSGIMLRFKFEADGSEGEIGLYREGEEEVFVFSGDEPVIYDGILPEAGKWEKWTIDPDDLGLKTARITGISFVVYGGRVNWDFTRFVPAPKNSKQDTGPLQGGNN